MGGVFIVAESWLNGSVENQRRGQMMAVYMLCNYVPMGLGQQLLSLAAPSSFILFTVASMLFSLALIPLALAPRGNRRSLTQNLVVAGRLGTNLATWRDRRDRRQIGQQQLFFNDLGV